MAQVTKKVVYRSKGGILNDSDGTILDYQFTVDPPFFTNKGRFYHLVLTIQEDGREEPTTQPFFLGGSEENRTVSDDGHQLSSPDGKSPVTPNTGSSDFFDSYDAAMEAAGVDGGAQVETGDDSVFELGIIGARVRFVQQPLGAVELAKLKADGRKTERKDKNDPSKSYPLTKTIVSKFYGIEKPKAAVKSGGPKTVADVKKMIAERKRA
jgi:hypothetical protein